MELEDLFSDIVRKASRGNRVEPAALARAANIEPKRLEELLSDASSPTEDEARAVARVLHLDPEKLAGIGARHWLPEPYKLDERFDEQVNTPHPSHGYFIIAGEHAAVIDPGGNVSNIVSVLSRRGAQLDYALITHKHADHIDGLASMRSKFPNARVAVHQADRGALGESGRDALIVGDGDTLPFGDGVIRAAHTPGHTDGSTCFLYEGAIFTGDTMFSGSVGGCVGERYGYKDLLTNVREKILSLPDETLVFPGHGPPSTIGQEKAHNPFF